MTQKDKRIVFKDQVIELTEPNNRVFFDGKFNPDNNTLKVYKYHGDINRFAEAFEGFVQTNESIQSSCNPNGKISVIHI